MRSEDNWLIEAACRNLMTRYCIGLDTRDSELFLSVFAADAIWELVNDTPRTLAGHDAIRAYFDSRQKKLFNLHLLQNPLVTVLGPTEAEGYCIALIVDGPWGDGTLPVPLRGTELITEYRDRFELRPEGWRIIRRTMRKLIDKKSAPPS
ncbi:hypothetical protein CVO77_10525 [Sphingopyxis lindanitolerans]|uniref:SnoaL-like domain-containing protein n=1 Tax=Sphingopyxis lindanitolerans TaxID=2054227 RepID=A0A2S8B953_9SPHN|nr:nuclear transport factor 2 family protein [Sphingopyxis lindanitolerans]PQM28843.1 hypothetical protein CVO77_10525 [Sphingopyxis lindanitolerans]